MRALFLTVLTLAGSVSLFCQAGAGGAPDLPNDPQKLLADAAPFYDFSDSALKPWHLKSSYQLYDMKGNATDKGVWEYWWESPKVRKISWTRADLKRTDWWTGGNVYRAGSGMPLRYFERAMESVLLSPLPSPAVLNAGRMKFDLTMVPAGQAKLRCAAATLLWEHDGKLQSPPSAIPQYYCFDPSAPFLLMSYSESITTEFRQIVKTQNHYLAKQVTIFAGRQKLFSMSVESIDGVDPMDTVFSPAADAVLVRAAVTRTDDKITTGSLVKKIPPLYPMVAKMARQQGVVILGATIGTDGRVHDLEVLATPSPLLSESALNAVKQWEYKPYLFNGVAVEVETVVNVNYSLGQ